MLSGFRKMHPRLVCRGSFLLFSFFKWHTHTHTHRTTLVFHCISCVCISQNVQPPLRQPFRTRAHTFPPPPPAFSGGGLNSILCVFWLFFLSSPVTKRDSRPLQERFTEPRAPFSSEISINHQKGFPPRPNFFMVQAVPRANKALRTRGPPPPGSGSPPRGAAPPRKRPADSGPEPAEPPPGAGGGECCFSSSFLFFPRFFLPFFPVFPWPFRALSAQSWA